MALALIMWGSIWALNKLAARIVGAKHRLLEAIVETGKVPACWRRHHDRKIAKAQRHPRAAAKVARLKERAQRDYLKKLARMERYVQGTPLVDSEETRQMLLGRLGCIRASWQALPETDENVTSGK